VEKRLAFKDNYMYDIQILEEPAVHRSPPMDFNLTDEQQMLRDGVRRFAMERYSFESRKRLLATAERFSEQNWATYAELGWLALALPEEVGGLDCSFVETSIVMQELGRVLALEPYATSAVLGAHIIGAAATNSQRPELLAQLGNGALRLALAHTEPDARYELSAVRTTTVQATGDGYEGYVLSGVKTLVFDAPSAHQLIVSAAFEDRRSRAEEERSGPDHRRSGSEARTFGLFLVPKDASGVTLTAYPLIDGTRAADVELKAVRLPKSALLVEPQRALDVLEEAIDRTVLAQVAEALGAMESVLDITNGYIKQRVQFGQPIGKFQALQHRMAEMFVEVQETRSILYRGMALLDAAPAERKRAVSAAKVVACNAGRFVGAQGIQLHGGIGMTEEHSIGHYYKKLVAFEKRYGDTEFHVSRYLGEGRREAGMQHAAQ
jgi:alkylation response protein AidB-like acyl-CoA dehydrogenase